MASYDWTSGGSVHVFLDGEYDFISMRILGNEYEI